MVGTMLRATINSRYTHNKREIQKAVRTYHGVGVEEDSLGVLREAPAVELREGHAEVGTLDQGQVAVIVRVEDVHLLHLVEHFAQDVSARRKKRVFKTTATRA
jgi:hypothetical protein